MNAEKLLFAMAVSFILVIMSSAPVFAVCNNADINWDLEVDIFDLATVGLAFGSEPGDFNWNPDADVKKDNQIDIFDLAGVGLNYGCSLSLEQPTPASNWDDLYGWIKWNITGQEVPSGYRIWILDPDDVPCGMFDIIYSGMHGFTHVYKDDSTTPNIDEGASIGDELFVVVENLTSHKIYRAWFDRPIIFHGDWGRYEANISVNP